MTSNTFEDGLPASKPDGNVPKPQPSTTTTSNTKSHIRSCINCARRKVGCDKREPCSNCIKHHVDCIFPGRKRAPRRSEKPQNTELLARLHKLEQIVKGVGLDESQVGDDQASDNGISTTYAQPEGENAREEHTRYRVTSNAGSIEERLGYLVVSEDKSRYLSTRFRSLIGIEIAEMRELLETPSDDEDEAPAMTSNHVSGTDRIMSTSQGSFLLGSPTCDSLEELRPSPSQIFALWEIFKDNVNPMIRILHIPTSRNLLLQACSNPESISKEAECLLFAIYLGAVVSLDASHCLSLLGKSKDAAIKQYRIAIEQALSRAHFLSSSSFMILQAFVFYVIFIRNQDDHRAVRALTRLAVHMAQNLGVHRDGTNFKLPVFETELRRRLWWQILVLNTRANEDNGTNLICNDSFSDTRFPTNINDEDIYPDMRSHPTPRTGCTDMTFTLLTCELCSTIHKLTLAGPDTDESLAAKNRIIDECRQRIENNYLAHCDPSVPILWVCTVASRMILAKIWLIAHCPLSLGMEEKKLTMQDRDRLFLSSVEAIECLSLLERNEKGLRWRWLFRTYMQWHVVVYILSELTTKEPGEDFERAWRAINALYNDEMSNDSGNQRHVVWKLVLQLINQVAQRRRLLLAKPNLFEPAGSMPGFVYGNDDTDDRRRNVWQERPLGVKLRGRSIGNSSAILNGYGQELPSAVNITRQPMPQQNLNGEHSTNDQQTKTTLGTRANVEDDDMWLSRDQFTAQNAAMLDWDGWDPVLYASMFGGDQMSDDTTATNFNDIWQHY